jgi:hypothetical protein
MPAGKAFCIRCGKPTEPAAAPANENTEAADIPAAPVVPEALLPEEQEPEADALYDNMPGTRKRKRLLIISLSVFFAGLLAVAAVLLFGSGKKKAYPKLFVMAETLNLRSSQFDGSDANVIDKAPYGAEVSILQTEGEWVKVIYNGQEGYMSGKYLTVAKDFYEANAIVSSFTGDTIKISETRFKKSLVNYFRNNNMRSAMAPDIAATWFKDDAGFMSRELWSIDKADLNSKTVLKGRFGLYKKNGLALIIKKDTDNSKRKLLVFLYDENEKEVTATAFDEPGIRSIILGRKGDFTYWNSPGNKFSAVTDVIVTSLPGDEHNMGVSFFIFRNGHIEKDFRTYDEEMTGD